MCQERNKLLTKLHYTFINNCEGKVINMLKIVFILLILSTSYLFSLEIDNKTTFNELLSHSEIYKDYNRSENILTIKNKKFKPNSKKVLPCGYSPKYDVWIRFTLTNTTANTIKKIIEYANPLTTYVIFFEENKLKKREGMFYVGEERVSLNPIFKTTLQPHQSKIFYIKASSVTTTLLIKLNLWNVDTFNKKEMTKQLLLALFFGAMSIVILYNLIIFIAIKELSYLFYALFFTTINFHHLIYKGVMSLYIFSSQSMITLLEYSSFIVALPTIFLALFTQHILKLKQYPKLNKTLNYILVLYYIFVITIQVTEAYQYRKFFFIMLVILFSTVLYALIKKNKKAYPLIFGWSLFISSGIAMYLSSSGTYDIFTPLPYYTESSLVLETMLFTLASKITIQNQAKIDVEKNRFLLQELNHRVNNNMQTILSVITLQKNEEEDTKIQQVIANIENRMMATVKLYSLLYMKNNKTVVNVHEYLSLITKNIKKTFKRDDVNIDIYSDVIMHSEYAIYCGLIVNEAVTNAFKYAFNHTNEGKIDILLVKKENGYYLKIKDNGSGFKKSSQDALGLTIIDTLATLQLEGKLTIERDNGVEINIEWRKNEKEY